ncbi:hypothetical protein TNCV_2873791 [Trichonephila clavipes]|nr:hypothetical protein TNCV_2873791 [Trichonephila clavipes]
MLMPNVFYNGVTLTKPGRWINRRINLVFLIVFHTFPYNRTGTRLEDTGKNVRSLLYPSNCEAWRTICHMSSHVVVFCWTNRNPERKDHWEKYREILANPVHLMIQCLFLARDTNF